MSSINGTLCYTNGHVFTQCFIFLSCIPAHGYLHVLVHLWLSTSPSARDLEYLGSTVLDLAIHVVLT